MPKRSQTRSGKRSTRARAAQSRPAAKKRAGAAARRRPSPRRPSPGKRPRSRNDEQPHVMSPTAVAAEALSTGVSPRSRMAVHREMPRQSELLQVGDVETNPLQAAYVGDEAPGGDMPTPDQDRVDDIGRDYGLSEADTGELHTSSELLSKRDRKRADLEAPRGRRGTRDSDRLR